MSSSSVLCNENIFGSVFFLQSCLLVYATEFKMYAHSCFPF